MATKTKNLVEETVTELRSQAKKAGIAASHMKKEDLIHELEKHAADLIKSASAALHSEDQPQGEIDALVLLKQDHAKVSALFKKVLAMDDGDSSMVKTAEQIIFELRLHTEAEETLFYPAVKKRAADQNNDDAKDEVLEAYVEHDSVKELMQKIEASTPSDESYKALIQVMSEQVEHHVQEEESEMFKQAKKLLKQDEINDLGRQILEFKQKKAAQR